MVLEIPNLELDQGIHSLSGKNGSGKTTLLKCIAGILPYEGNISINGIRNSKANMMKYLKLVRYSPAEPVFPNFLKSQDLIAFYSSMLPYEQKDIDILARSLGVSKFMDVQIGHYSSGMLKKLSLLLTFIGNSEVIILDEPFNALDTETCERLNEIISQRRAAGTSFLTTTHQNNLHVTVNKGLQIENFQLTINEPNI